MDVSKFNTCRETVRVLLKLLDPLALICTADTGYIGDLTLTR